MKSWGSLTITQEIALSSGSACTSASLEPSYVLRALGSSCLYIPFFCSYLPIGAAEDMAHSSLRFGIGRFTTEAEIDFVIEKIAATVQKLRDMRYNTFFPYLLSLVLIFLLVLCGRWYRKELT